MKQSHCTFEQGRLTPPCYGDMHPRGVPSCCHTPNPIGGGDDGDGDKSLQRDHSADRNRLSLMRLCRCGVSADH